MKRWREIIICLLISLCIAPSCKHEPAEEDQIIPLSQVSFRILSDYFKLAADGKILEQPIEIQILDHRNGIMAGIEVSVSIASGTGSIRVDGEKFSELTLKSSPNGIIGFFWEFGQGNDNRLQIMLSTGGIQPEPAFICPKWRRGDEVMILLFQWLHTNSIDFPYIQGDYTLDYDGRILETNNFLTFSDASTDEVKIDFASLAEISLAEIMKSLEIQSTSELGIVDTHSKIKIYTRKNFDEQPRQYTFSYGFLLYGKDSRWMEIWGPGTYARFNHEVKHEVMHMVQYLMGVHYQMCDDWFMEGIAEQISGGAFMPITTAEQLEAWLSNPTLTVHPIDIQSTDDYPHPYLQTSPKYYPMFHLIMSYLLDMKGLGRTYGDVKRMFGEIAETNNFRQAFHNHFGVSAEDLKTDLYHRLREFLK
jgi:hypothetical protein